MLLQALRVEIEMKNLNLQVPFLVQKGVGTRSTPKRGMGTPFPRVHTPLHPCMAILSRRKSGMKAMNNWFVQSIDPTQDWVNERNQIEGTTYLAH